jgi:D-threonate/D-erythronate kinase
VPLTGPIAVTWRDDAQARASLAFDCGTRELPAEAARRRIERLTPLLDDGAPSFKKLDSLLRGHAALELAVCMRRFDHCVLAPAFPFQGRITRNGRQLARVGNVWRDTGVDLAAELRAHGVTVAVRDAETDADLDAIVAEGRSRGGRVLWCGAGGLAGALAGRHTVPRPILPPPIQALIGSRHPATLAQIARVPPGQRHAIVVCDLPPGIDPATARRRIAAAFPPLLRRVGRPGTLFVTGARHCATCATRWARHGSRWMARSSQAPRPR